MEALTLSSKDYKEALGRISESYPGDETYLSQFIVNFPDGINTASVLEICRVIQVPTMENKIQLMKLCIEGKNVEVKCPNGEKEKFCMSSTDASLDAIPLFAKDPLAVIAIADAIHGYILKKYVRLSKPKEEAANAE
jgi:hypothetical protein